MSDTELEAIAKRSRSSLVRRLVEQYKRMKLIGGQMSNVCYNLSQAVWSMGEGERKEMGKLYKEWDQI